MREELRRRILCGCHRRHVTTLFGITPLPQTEGSVRGSISPAGAPCIRYLDGRPCWDEYGSPYKFLWVDSSYIRYSCDSTTLFAIESKGAYKIFLSQLFPWPTWYENPDNGHRYIFNTDHFIMHQEISMRKVMLAMFEKTQQSWLHMPYRTVPPQYTVPHHRNDQAL